MDADHDTGKFRVIDKDLQYEFKGRSVYQNTHHQRGLVIRRFFDRVRDGFTLSYHAFDDVDTDSSKPIIDRRR